MAQPHEVLQAALHQRVGFEAIQHEVKASQVRYFGRVRPSYMPTWLAAMRDLLQGSEGASWTIDLSRQYFLRGDKLFFGWRIIIQGQALPQALAQATSIVQKVQVAVKQLDEVPLHASPNRNALRNGRGAQPTERAVVGPLARNALGM